ncbi:MAG: DUF4810 domain-containing protein [Bacteroidales bacterium]|nr:DUF4810 domain-containing protein [Bacteroidales bacterium]
MIIIRDNIKKAITICGVALLFSCGGTRYSVDEKVLLEYGKEPNEANTENLSKSYAAVINKSRKTGLKEAGIYSDYAVTLVKQGKRAEANNWFNKEMESFPSSKSYVMQLKRILIPEYQNDNTVRDISAIEGDETEEATLTPKQRSEAEKKAAQVMGEDTVEEDTKALDSESGESNTDEMDSESEEKKD